MPDNLALKVGETGAYDPNKKMSNERLSERNAKYLSFPKKKAAERKNRSSLGSIDALTEHLMPKSYLGTYNKVYLGQVGGHTESGPFNKKVG